MASKNRTTLKGYFETGDIPSQAQYADLIDSNLNLSETTAQQVSSDIHTSDTIMFNNSNTSGITYADSTGNVRYGLQFSRTSNLVSLTNNAANGFVQIKANGSSAGSGGEVTSSIFTSYSNEFLMPITASGNISSSGTVTAEHILSSDDIVAQGNISASGNIISSQITSSGGILNKGNLFQEKSIALNQDKPLQSKSGSSYVDLIRLNPNNTILVGNSAANNVTNQTELFTFASFKFKVNPSYAYSPASSGTGGEIVRISGGFGEPTGLYVHGAISASRTITGNNLKLDGSQVDFTNLPTSDPNVAGRLYNDGGSLKISAG